MFPGFLPRPETACPTRRRTEYRFVDDKQPSVPPPCRQQTGGMGRWGLVDYHLPSATGTGSSRPIASNRSAESTYCQKRVAIPAGKQAVFARRGATAVTQWGIQTADHPIDGRTVLARVERHTAGQRMFPAVNRFIECTYVVVRSAGRRVGKPCGRIKKRFDDTSSAMVYYS